MAVLQIILPAAIGLVYAGTGGWSAERWNAALAMMGFGGTSGVALMAYERGYNTYNPALRIPELEPPIDPPSAPPRPTDARDWNDWVRQSAAEIDLSLAEPPAGSRERFHLPENDGAYRREELLERTVHELRRLAEIHGWSPPGGRYVAKASLVDFLEGRQRL